MFDECQVTVEKPAAKKSTDHIGESSKVFSLFDSGLQAVASNFELKHGEDDEDKSVWKIMSEAEQITVCQMEEEHASKDGMLPSDDTPF